MNIKNLICLLLLFPLNAVAQNNPTIVTPEYKPDDFSPPRAMIPTEWVQDKQATVKNHTVLEIDEVQLLKYPKLLNKLLDDSVMAGDKDGIQLLLPVYRKLTPPVYDPVLADFAQSYLESMNGNYHRAVAILRKLLSVRPSEVIRFHLAVALFHDKQNESAKEQFEKILSDEKISKQQRAVAEKYLQVIATQYDWSNTFTLYYQHEPNINNAPLKQAEGNLSTDGVVSANGLLYGWGINKEINLGGHYLLQLQADTMGKSYFKHKQYDMRSANVSTALAWRNGKTEIGIQPFIGQIWWRDKEEGGWERYAKQIGVVIKSSHRINHNWQYGSQLRYEYKKHQTRHHFDGQRKQWTQNLIYRYSPKQTWFAGLDFIRESLNSQSDSSRELGVYAGWVQEWPLGFSSRQSLSVSRQKYDEPMLFFNQRRQDTMWQSQISLWHRNLHFYGITPRLSWQHIRNRSNIFLYDYQKNNLFIELSKTF